VVGVTDYSPPRLLRIDGQLARIVPTGPARAKLVYLAGEPEDRLPTEVEYALLEFDARRRRGRLSLKEGGRVLLVERIEPNLRDTLNAGEFVQKLLAKFGFKRHRHRPSE